MKRAVRRPRVAILGCGRVGRALAGELLVARPAPVRGKLMVWSRRRQSVAALRRLVASQGKEQRLRVCASAWEAVAGADVVLLCVADDALGPFVRELAREGTGKPTPVVLSTNGFLPLSTLAPLKRLGFPVGRMHPLAPVPAGLELTNLTMAPFGLEGDPRALRAARSLVKGIDGIALRLEPGAAPAYHAAASLLGGGLVALFDQAEHVMRPALRSPASMRTALADFAGTVLCGLEGLGPERALTGALARGSEAIVRGHLVALEREPGALDLYCLLGERMLALAQARGSLGARRRKVLDALLKSARCREKRTRRRSDRATS